MLISGQFAYVYWLKSIRVTALLFMVVVLICLSLNAFYIYQGGGENITKLMHEMVYR